MNSFGNQLLDMGAEPMVLAWLAIILAHLYAIAFLRRRRSTAKRTAPAPVRTERSLPVAAAAPAMSAAIQIERLFGFVEQATASAERAMAAHAAAAKHLDSAEYQLTRLFDEFPLLARARTEPAAAASRVTQPDMPAPRALAA